jgi:hypothetical protein
VIKSYIVAVSIDKVQSFLFNALHAHVQEKQTNNGTLKDVINSSHLISNQFYEDIGIEGTVGEFVGHIDSKLLKCSGICIFTTLLDETQINSKLDALFRRYYKDFKGQLQLKYVCFERSIQDNADKLEAIKESKKRLKHDDCLNAIIARQSDLLFQFDKSSNSDPRQQSVVSGERYNAFSDTINALFSKEDKNNENHFRIAVIKADLDGMGDLFGRLDSYETYRTVSDLLSQYVCLDSLYEQTVAFQGKNPDFKLYPLYIAGDDIFFAVPAAQLIDGVELCTSILQIINTKIKQYSEKYSLALEPLNMSIGIDFTYNREPIRYFYERVQWQIECAKAAAPLYFNQMVPKTVYVKVSINEYTFYIYDTPKKDKQNKKRDDGINDFKKNNFEKANWHHFIHHVKRLKQAMKDGIAANHFFYSLLNKITESQTYNSELKYSNAVLYHVLPQYVDSPNKELRESELLILEGIINQAFVKQGVMSVLSFGPAQRKRLEAYVRLLLLFSDPRFKITERALPEEDNSPFAADVVKRIRSSLFNKTMSYLYEKSLMETGSKTERLTMRDVFVKKESYKATPKLRKKKPATVEIYRTLRISSSMFHRLKRIDCMETASKMIASVNDYSKDEIAALNRERAQVYKAPLGLFFDKDAFSSIARRSGVWNQDFIDSLLIFYQFKDLSIRYKSKYSSQKNNKEWKHESQ